MRSYPQVPLILSCNMFFFYNIVAIANKDKHLTMPIMKGYVYDMAFFDDTYPSVTKINVECSKSSKVKWTGKKMKIKVKKLVFVNKLMNDVDLIRSLEIRIKIRIATMNNCYRTYDPECDF